MVTAADVALWARVPAPDDVSPEAEVLERVIAAVTERAVTLFGLIGDPAGWRPDETQAVIEVAAETWIAGRNAPQGVAQFEGGPLVRAQSIDYGLKRRLSVPVGFA
ncbi:MAG TPA: hypothetical protein VNQ73_16475 [Ilumatobacter sp.]|nr:hypothetical protein [Ilumatobacter sp.]